MEYTIHGFSQEIALKLGLDDRDLLILRWFIRFKDSGKMATKIIDGDKYYWIKYEGIVEDLPIINIKSCDAVYRRLKKMCKVKILNHKTIKKGGTYSYYNLGENYLVLIDNRSDLSDLKPTGTDIKPIVSDIKPYGTDLKSEQKTLIPYPNTINPNISSCCTGESDIDKILEFYRVNIAKENITLFEKEEIEKLYKNIGNELLLEAMKISIKNRKPTLGYIQGIAKKWSDKNLTTLDELRIYKVNHSSVNNSMDNNKKFIPRVRSNKFNDGTNNNFAKYTPEELEKLLQESQKGKFNREN